MFEVYRLAYSIDYEGTSHDRFATRDFDLIEDKLADIKEDVDDYKRRYDDIDSKQEAGVLTEKEASKERQLLCTEHPGSGNSFYDAIYIEVIEVED